MDCNSYSYAPTMLDGDEKIIEQYENDDMSAEFVYWAHSYYVYATSYDGSMDEYELFPAEQLHKAKALYDFIVNNYSDTPPGRELRRFIKALRKAA